MPRVIVRPGAEVLLPRSVDWAVHSSQCIEPDCVKGLGCRHPAHEKLVVGGHGQELRRVVAGEVQAAQVHAGLQPPPPPATSAEATDEALLRSVGGA